MQPNPRLLAEPCISALCTHKDTNPELRKTSYDVKIPHPQPRGWAVKKTMIKPTQKAILQNLLRRDGAKRNSVSPHILRKKFSDQWARPNVNMLLTYLFIAATFLIVWLVFMRQSHLRQRERDHLPAYNFQEEELISVLAE